MVRVMKPLTKREKSFNEKHPHREIKPYIGFYIDEKKYPEESKLWELLGYSNLIEIVKEGKLKVDIAQVEGK